MEYQFSNKNILTFQHKLILFRNSHYFNLITTALIVIYSILLGLQTYIEKNNDIFIIFSILDYGITLYFIFEISLKIYAEKDKKEYFTDYWNLFDFFIVGVSLIPLGLFDSVIVARLLRIFRALRLVTINGNIKKIIMALEGAIPSILNIVILMFIIFYIYAILGVQLFSTLNSGLWHNVSISLLTLFRVFTFEDWTDIMYEAMEVYPYAWIYFVSFIIINAFVIFNLFIAVIIDEMSKLNNNHIQEFLDQEDKELKLILREIREIKDEIKDIKLKENNV